MKIKNKALIAVGFLAGCFSEPVGVPRFQPANDPNNRVQVTALAAPASAFRGDTVVIAFTVLNDAPQARTLDVQVSLDSMVFFTNGQTCAEPGASACAVVLDIVELDVQPNPICQFVNPDAAGIVSDRFAGGESRSYSWHWTVARLSCVASDNEPVAGEYWLTAYARYVKQNGTVVAGWRRLRFTVKEIGT